MQQKIQGFDMTDYNHTPSRRRWLASPEGKAAKARADAKWSASAKGKAAQAANNRAMWAKYPEKRKARRKVSNALRDNRLKRADACEYCGSQDKLNGHHASYAEDMWLCVTWLCVPCHQLTHNEARY
jgi:hypothetical protein